MGYWGWKPYVSVAERKKQAEQEAAKAKKAGKAFSPIPAYRGALAKTFWGKAWCDNLENYSDFENRLPRGRTYVRNGSVIDLKMSAGQVKAQVMGSDLYQVEVAVDKVPDSRWKDIGRDCAGSIDSLVELLQGKLSKAVMERICKPGSGLFPSPKEIKFSCSCPDWASMCKHVAAVLYGVGARLDLQPELLFSLRHVDANDLVAQAGAGLPKTKKAPKSGKVLSDSDLGDVFGIELAESAPMPKPRARQGKATTAKATTAKATTAKATTAKATTAKATTAKATTAKATTAKATTAKATTAKATTAKATTAKATTAKATATKATATKAATAKNAASHGKAAKNLKATPRNKRGSTG